MSRLTYQLPNFTFPPPASDDVFGTVVAQAKEADASGFDRLSIMDHFYQLPQLGAPEEPMLECYTTLGALAAHTSNVRLSAMVTGNTYRNPTLLAKAITAVRWVISSPRHRRLYQSGGMSLQSQPWPPMTGWPLRCMFV